MDSKWKLLIALVIMGCGFEILLYAVCNNIDHRHKDAQVARCDYSQKDLKKIRKKNKDRHNQMGIKKGTCFYCGCPVEEHSEG